MSELSPESVVDSRTVFEGRLITVKVDTVRLEGGATTTREIVEHPGAVAMVVPDATGRVAMVRQWRSALRRWTLEIPAGTREPNESAEDCAKRELAEEMGLRAAHWSPLLEVYTSPGWCNELIQIFLATGLATESGNPEADEMLQREWVDLATIPSRMSQGEIRDAKTVAGLLAYLQRPRGG